MKKIMLMLAALIAVGVWLRPQTVDAASASATLIVSKRVSAPNEDVSQQTVPLAGARYQVTRIEAAGGAPIDAADPSSYRAVSGSGALSTVLTTDGEGFARESGLALNATYLVQELVGSGVTKAAAPIALVFNAEHTTYTYTPKSGLDTAPGEVPHQQLPSTFEPVGNGTTRQRGDHILQTGGQYRLPGGMVLLVMSLLMLAAVVGAGMRRPKRLA